MSQGSGGWYVRARGRVLGPFNWSQLTSMRDRGQLLQDHDVSQDRRSWVKAADMAGLYAPAAAPSPAATTANVEWPSGSPGEQTTSPTAQSVPCWFIARGEAHHGPLHLEDVQRMIDAGELGATSLIWKDGLADWVPASQVSGLWFATAAGQAQRLAQTIPAQSQSQQPAHVSALAVASLVLGLLWLCGLGSLLATIFGAVATSQISRSNGTITGKGMALAGLILGILGLCLLAIFVAFGFSGFFAAMRDQARNPR